MLRILLLVTVLLASSGLGSRTPCSSRRIKSKWLGILSETRCMEPKDTVISLPVPEGYDMVYPGAVQLKRCSGLFCKDYNHECLGVPGKTITVTVQAYKADQMKDSLCTEVSVQEHEYCECGCNKDSNDCSATQEFDRTSCQCQCKPEVREACFRRQEHVRVMWDETNCNCPCDRVEECDSGQYWVPDMCSCETILRGESAENQIFRG